MIDEIYNWFTEGFDTTLCVANCRFCRNLQFATAASIPPLGLTHSRLRAVFAIRILEIGAADRVFRAPGLEGSGTVIQNQPRGAGRELLERRGGSVREAPLAAIAVLVFAVRTAEG
jgi:hypothetical protein